MIDASFQIGVLLVRVHIPESQSLKQKRMVLRSLKERTAAKFPVSVSELDGQDKWQVATLGFAGIANERRHLESCLQKVVTFIESFPAVRVCETEIDFL